jgi:hypothetical protein
MEEQLKDPEFFQSNASNAVIFNEYESTKKTLETLMEQWLELQD